MKAIKPKEVTKTSISISKSAVSADVLASVILNGDLRQLTSEQKVQYYTSVCKTVGLNPSTKPFDYIVMNNKEVLYANKGCAEQLRDNYGVSIKIASQTVLDKICIVTAEATDKTGRTDSATGCVFVGGLFGEALANAFMKAETKAKRRVTLSICGLNMLDETEIDSAHAAPLPVAPSQSPIIENQSPVILTAAQSPDMTRDQIAQKIIATGKQLNLRGADLSAFIHEQTGKATKDLLYSEMESVLIQLETELGRNGDLCPQS